MSLSLFSSQAGLTVYLSPFCVLLFGSWSLSVPACSVQPFWPMGTGCARGFLAAFDTAWMINSWAQGRTVLDVLAERYTHAENYVCFSGDPGSLILLTLEYSVFVFWQQWNIPFKQCPVLYIVLGFLQGEYLQAASTNNTWKHFQKFWPVHHWPRDTIPKPELL